jgi:hypothetical protein
LLDTDGLDFDGLTGVNGVSIDLSDNTDSGFYAVGSWYTVILGPVTIDTQTVYINLASFRIVAAESVTGKPKVDVDAFGGTAGTFSSGRPEVNTTHAAGTAWGSGAITAAAIASDAITAAKLASDVATEINTGVLAVLGALNDTAADGDPTNTDTMVAYLKQLINVLMGTAGIVSFPASATPGNAVSLAEAIRQIYDEVAGLNGDAMATPLDAAGVRTAIGLASANLDTQLGALPTAAENADAVWDEALSGHTTSGTAGEAQNSIDDILTDTAEIGAAGAGLTEAGGTGDQLTAIPWNAAWDAEVQSEVEDALDVTLADSVPSDGTRPTLRQAMYMVVQFLMEREVSSTTVTVKKVDGSTTLLTLALDDASNPTSITRDG